MEELPGPGSQQPEKAVRDNTERKGETPPQDRGPQPGENASLRFGAGILPEPTETSEQDSKAAADETDDEVEDEFSDALSESLEDEDEPDGFEKVPPGPTQEVRFDEYAPRRAARGRKGKGKWRRKKPGADDEAAVVRLVKRILRIKR